MTKEIFSLKMFIRDCQKCGMHYLQVYEALKYWANDCKGKTREELEKIRGYHYNKNHFEIVHIGGNENE